MSLDGVYSFLGGTLVLLYVGTTSWGQAPIFSGIFLKKSAWGGTLSSFMAKKLHHKYEPKVIQIHLRKVVSLPVESLEDFARGGLALAFALALLLVEGVEAPVDF